MRAKAKTKTKTKYSLTDLSLAEVHVIMDALTELRAKYLALQQMAVGGETARLYSQETAKVSILLQDINQDIASFDI